VRNRLLKRCLGVVATASVLALAFGPAAEAAPVNTSPHWFNGHIDQFRAVGSETTFYVMNAINNLYSQSAIFGCTLVTSDFQTCNTAGDTADTDTLDNYDRDEFNNGEGIGSGNGLNILCGAPAAAIHADFARSSRPSNGSSCENSLTFQPYGKDGLVGVTFDKEHAVTTGSATAPIGPVAAGWRTGDPLDCNLQPNPGSSFDNGVNGCNGVPFKDISNVGGASSIAFRIWCDTAPATRINDWGQLTDPSQPVGSGAAIGVPIGLWGVNPGSGTFSVWGAYIGCNANSKQPDAAHLIQENNAPQIRSVSTQLFPGDPIKIENEVERSLYWGSFGVMNANRYSAGGGSFTKINGINVGPASENASLPTFRNIFNVFKPTALRGSVAGFLNWICSTSNADHSTDLTSGLNYNQELTATIQTKFGFPRLSCPIVTPTDPTT
jgi:hypothetical protein